jgi:putative FmdB family regulatory protein
MPIYEYQCQDCERIEEVFQKVSDTALTTCPHCKGTLDKLISQSSFHLKGSGWYVTDYGDSKTAPPDNKADKKTETTKNPAIDSLPKKEPKA